MPEPEQQTQPGSSPAPDAPAASSAEQPPSQPQVPGEGTPPTTPPEPEKKPWNMPPEERWEELRRERDEARRAHQELAARVAQPVQPAQPQADPWEGLTNHPDPGTAQFYQQQKRLVEHAVQQGRDQAFRELQPMLTSIQRGQAAITLKDFRREHPEIKPDSEEERQISGLMQPTPQYPYGLDLYTAKAIVRERLLEAENRALKQKQASTVQKVAAANIEASAGVPQASGLPGQPQSWQEQVGAVVDKGGGMLDAAKAIFGLGRLKPTKE